MVEWCSRKNEHHTLEYGMFHVIFQECEVDVLGDVVLCIVYLRNRSPSHALRNKNPYEMWYEHIPSERHLKVFGSTCYSLIPT